jgi:hypothetical protein
MSVFVLAQEQIDKTLWYPTILGILVVVAGIALFCGSIYLLLGTNLGARLGFLVAFKGRIPAWQVQQVVKSPDEIKYPQARTLAKKDKVSTIEAANVKAAVDERLVTIQPTAIHKPTPEENKFAKFDKVTDYQTENTYEIGGSNPNFLDFQFTHKPLVAVVQVCAVQPANTPFGVPPPKPVCDQTSDKNGFVVLKKDLGQLRLPPILVFIASLVLFGLGLLGLHWRERDEAERARQQAAGGGPAPVPARP